jgi:hypothetical protein
LLPLNTQPFGLPPRRGGPEGGPEGGLRGGSVGVRGGLWGGPGPPERKSLLIINSVKCHTSPAESGARALNKILI